MLLSLFMNACSKVLTLDVWVVAERYCLFVQEGTVSLEIQCAVFSERCQNMPLAIETAVGSVAGLARVRGYPKACPDAFPSLCRVWALSMFFPRK